MYVTFTGYLNPIGQNVYGQNCCLHIVLRSITWHARIFRQWRRGGRVCVCVCGGGGVSVQSIMF